MGCAPRVLPRRGRLILVRGLGYPVVGAAFGSSRTAAGARAIEVSDQGAQG